MKQRLNTFIILALLAFFSGRAEVQASRLSPEAEISILTAGPGEDLYAVFGHSAMWVYDPINDIDEVYNWGTFDFETPNFYSKFLQGRLLYQLSVSSMQQFLFSYNRAGRWVEQQRLNLTEEEKQRIDEFLQQNRRPENIHYLYDFFYDNCATRIRDILEQELDIDWGPNPHEQEQRTFRDLVALYVAHIPWTGFGIDILLGMPSDKVADQWHAMFIPDELFESVQRARHDDGRLLADAHAEILPEQYIPGEGTFFSPTVILWLFFILGLLSLGNKKLAKVFASFHFSILGLLGIVVFFMWFLSDHIATGMNLDLLWTLPTHLYFVYRAGTKKPGRLPGLYFKVVMIISLILLVTWPLNPQDFHQAALPMIALSAVLAAVAGNLIKTPVSLKGQAKL